MEIRVYVKGEVVARILVKRQKTKVWLAEKAELPSPAYLSDLLAGRRTAGPQVRIRLIKALRPMAWDDVFRIVEQSLTAAAV